MPKDQTFAREALVLVIKLPTIRNRQAATQKKVDRKKITRCRRKNADTQPAQDKSKLSETEEVRSQALGLSEMIATEVKTNGRDDRKNDSQAQKQ